MKNRMTFLRTCVLSPLFLLASFTSEAAPIILSDAVQTITLNSGTGLSNGSNVAYNPVFDRYYTSKIGGNDPFYSFNGSGTLVQSVANINGIPSRAINYNANTGNLEAVTFNAKSNGQIIQGLLSLGLDASGNYTGTSTEILPTVPGVQDSQPIVAYSSNNDRLYSLGIGSNIVNVIDRADGSLESTINLDLSGIGPVSLAGYAIGYDDTHDVLVSYDTQGLRALVHDLTGNLLGTSLLPAGSNDPSNYNIGYTNDQFFVHSNGTWQGFQIFSASSGTTPAPATLLLFVIGLAGIGFSHRRKQQS